MPRRLENPRGGEFSKYLRGRGIRVAGWNPRPSLLLLPQVPKPMHGVAPRVVLGKTWWDQIRREAFARTHYCCAACGVWKMEARYHKWLEGHEVYSIDYPRGLMTYVETVGLCHCCHNYIHVGRLQALLEQGEISHAKFRTIIARGNAILDRASLQRPDPYTGRMAKWGNWRLVIGRRKYPPRFKSEKEWTEHFTRE